MMKLRIITRHLPNRTNHYWNFSGNTLLTKHLTSVLISSPYHPRRTVRMAYPKYTCQRSLHLLHMYLPSHRSRTLLRSIHYHWPSSLYLILHNSPNPYTHSGDN
uniref:Uncharacterized protein n=1 Tax=Chelonoidis abingdonii TaxID=106734 RepID=A0A8C0H2K7_CHEAB